MKVLKWLLVILVANIDRDNVTEAHVNHLMELPGKTPGITNFVKFQSHLNLYLLEIYNFTVSYRIARAWTGRLPSGHKLGFIGILSRGEVDMAMAAAIYVPDRKDDCDFVHTSYRAIFGFVFRVTSDSSASEASLMAPLHRDVWTSLFVTIFIILLVGLLVRGIYFFTKLSVSGSTSRDFVDIFAALCQQGIDPMPRNVVQRIIVLMMLIMAFFLYNYYTSSVVGVLLSTPVKGPRNIEEIVASSYKLSVDDTSFHRVIFRERKTSNVERIYDKIIRLKRGPTDLPMYAPISTAIPFIKSGRWAWHSELTESFSTIAKNLNALEICDLRTTSGLYESAYDNEFAVLPKFSQYKEMMKISFMWLHETGFVKRGLTIYRSEKPECFSGISVFAVGFQAVSAAFYVLIAGHQELF
ncbi:ionotropic receptor 75a-like [Lutzomyia longipalpis]|uniref:ionotropic receptor 75a-like n=1 Tax=Lutzomyia longipalpis TaxID=7200 RepID=UPI002484085A|nr:ionotropic receptor 75a-like [Lutzomyia longipalpis]